MTTNTDVCCGQRQPGTPGAALVNACQLCPNSPTYWRDQPPSDTATSPVTPEASAPRADHSGGLNWSSHATGDPLPCRICRKPAFMRDGEGRPCHKVCAERHAPEVAR
ncbi:hypothetical protein [Micromonospora sp. NPDC048169]|uniref:hypothetical protein n=1 Tax=Micromonospora sp. NPDC048169 TaxID=3154711 RepID=UPI0033F5FA25